MTERTRAQDAGPRPLRRDRSSARPGGIFDLAHAHLFISRSHRSPRTIKRCRRSKPYTRLSINIDKSPTQNTMTANTPARRNQRSEPICMASASSSCSSTIRWRR